LGEYHNPSPHPHPYIYVAQLKILGANRIYPDGEYTMVGQQSIWNPAYAFGYPSLATNANGEVGIAFGWGGYSRHADPGVGILTGTRSLLDLGMSSSGPQNSRWGDYTTIRMDYPKTTLFAATGYITTQTTDPFYAVFGRFS
jgi:hypothetical protein